MTQGIASSLNITLARLSSIESNFGMLENIFEKTNSMNNIDTAYSVKQEGITPNTNDTRDFKTILEEKIANNETKIKDKLQEIVVDDAIENQVKKSIEESVEESISPVKKAALKLKAKISSKSQEVNIDEIIDTFASKYNIDGDFIKAMIKQESGFNQNAKSKKGAMGLMQLMPSTAESLGIKDILNPVENIEGGIKYFKGLLDRFNNDERLALAAYNAGPNAVKRYGGIPPYKETQNYVNSIISNYNKIKGANL